MRLISAVISARLHNRSTSRLNQKYIKVYRA